VTAGSDDARDPAPQPGAQAARPKSGAAAAASRARRIGGRVSAGEPTTQPTAKQPTATSAPISTTKPAPPREAPDRKQARPRAAEPVQLPGWLRWAPTGILTAGVVAMAVILVVFSHGVWWARTSGQTVREQVLAAAKTCAAAENTYKYTALDSFEAKALRCTTGSFTGTVRHIIETVVKKNAPTLKASQTVQINTGGIESVTDGGHRWKVVLFGQLSATNVNSAKGSLPDPFAAEVIMQKAHGKWLMAGLNTISPPLG
jgi:hypothetical protein